MCHRFMFLLFVALSHCASVFAADEKYGEFEVIQLYTQDELNRLAHDNKHLQRIKADDCQLVEDIKAHATKVKEPSYVYLWGDMLAWGVCVKRDVKLGMHYIEQSAKQGLLPAIEQLGRYYERGTLVQQNKARAIIYYREAALQGFVRAQLSYVRMLNAGYGSPVDYENAYNALFHSVIGNKKTKRQAQRLLSKLASKMPGHIVERARMKKFT